MRVLVIGGTGKISSGVVAALLERKRQVVLFNISFGAYDAASSLRAFRRPVDHFVHCSTVMTLSPRKIPRRG